MYSSIEIENFRGLRHISLENLSPINILTGFNDAGKTSILEALYLHASGPLAGAQTIQTLRPGRMQQQLAVGPTPENPWESLFYNFDMSNPIRLSAKTRKGSYRLTFRGGSSSRADLDDGAQTIVGSEFIDRTNAITITEQRGSGQGKRYVQILDAEVTNAATVPPSISVAFKSDPQATEPFIRASLLMGNFQLDLAAGYSALRRRSTGVDLTESLQEIDDRIDYLEVLVNNGRAELHASVNDTLMPLQLLGDGPNSLARTLIAMASVRDGILLVDEVGSGVHYSVLPKIWRTLYRAAKRLNVQLFATTHSLETLVAAAQVAKDNPNDLSVFRIDRADRTEDPRVVQFAGSKLETAIDFNAELR